MKLFSLMCYLFACGIISAVLISMHPPHDHTFCDNDGANIEFLNDNFDTLHDTTNY